MPVTDLKAYFDEARSWEADRLREAEGSRRLAWRIAAAAGTLAALAVGAVAALAPLKSVTPFVVRVDRSTGAVDVVSALRAGPPQSYDEAISKHFLAQYVRAREGWLAPAAEANFRQVSVMSTPAEQERWADAFRPTNPASPQNVFGPTTDVSVDIRAVSFVAKGVANVRFHRSIRRTEGVTDSDWIATVAFIYTRAPMREGDRLRNPLGFQVTSYRADPEVVP